jgi:ribonuclease HI
MLRSGAEDRHHCQSCLALKAFTQDIENSGYQFQKTGTKSTITASSLLKDLSIKTPKQAIRSLNNYTIIDKPNDGKNAGSLNINLISYDYGVQHKSFLLSRKNPNSGINIMRTILSLDMAGEKFGNSIKNNKRWKELNLAKPSQLDLFQTNKNTPSNLYAGTEMLGALEGLEFLLNKKASNPSLQTQSTTVAMVMDGRPERRSWWDTRTDTASDSITGQAIPLPKSLGQEAITTSGLLYDTKGNPHFFKNNQGQWQWKEMQKDLNTALDRLADQSTNPTSDVQVNLYGLGDTSNASLDKIYQDLASNQIFDNSSSSWSYSHQTIQSLGDINF